MKARLIRNLKAAPSHSTPGAMLSPGTEIEHPEAWVLVMNGDAEPADDECAARCPLSVDQKARILHARERLERGIHPDDWDAYDRGEMIGYAPDGSKIPGPNCVETSDEEPSSLWLPEEY